MAELNDIRTRIKFRIGSKEAADDQIDQNLNEAIRHTILRVRPQEMQTTTTFTTTSGKFKYSFATDLVVTDLLAIEFVRDQTDDVEILQGARQHFNRLQQDTTNTSSLGNPRRWVREGENIILYSRIPDATARTIKVSYLQRPADLSSTNTTFPLNDEWLLPTEQWAAGLTLLDLNANDKAGAKFGLYEQMITSREDPEGIEDESPEGLLLPVSNTMDGGDGGEF